MRVKNQLESFFSNLDLQSNDYDKKGEKGWKHKNANEDFNKKNDMFINDYEELLRKHESDIRNHIKIQHQYRIFADGLKTKIEELEKSNVEYKKTIVNLQEVNFQ